MLAALGVRALGLTCLIPHRATEVCRQQAGEWELLWLNFPCSQPWCVLPAWASSAAKPGMLAPTARQVMDEQGLCSSPGAVRVLDPRSRCWARCCTEGLWHVPQVGMQQGAFSGMAKDFG